MKKLFLIILVCTFTNSNYIHSMDRDNQQAKLLLAEIGTSIESNWSIVDLDCGNGKLPNYMARELVYSGHVYTLGKSDSIVNDAWKHNSRNNISFRAGDPSEFNFHYFIPIKSSVIFKLPDIITSFYSLHWIEDQQKVINNAAHWLKPDGFLLIVMAFDEDSSTTKIIKRLIQRAFSEQWIDFVTEDIKDQLSPLSQQKLESFLKTKYFPQNIDHMTTMLKAANLTPIAIKSKNDSVIFTSKEEFVDWINNWLANSPILKAIFPSPTVLKNFITTEASYCYADQYFIGTTGCVRYKEQYLTVIAQKQTELMLIIPC